jgi:tRNA threonylcarbamoyladenosine biosynthesis protein TsaB
VRESDPHKLRILAVETCLGACSVALLDGETLLAHTWQAMERGHAEALAPMVQAAMARHGFAALDRLAVTVGPGTFTGQRVGLSFMRGLRLALNKPLIGVASLEAMAAAAVAETGMPRAAVLHDARRGEAYLSLVADGVATPPRVLAFPDAIQAVRAFGPCVLAGTGAPAAKAQLDSGFALSAIRQPDAAMVARLAAARPAPPADAPPPAPLYLRAPDAKLPGARQPDVKQSGEPDPVRPFAGPPAALAKLHATAFDRPWDEAALRALLAGPGVFALAGHHEGRMAGFVLARAAGGEAEILTLAVLPAARRRGLGHALMRAAARRAAALGAESLFLEVGTENPAALALYARLGFARVGARKGYYDSRSQAGDALVLKAALPLPGDLA